VDIFESYFSDVKMVTMWETSCFGRLFLLVLCLTSFVDISLAGRNYYDVLGVKRSATRNEIRKAFKKLSLQYHPDKIEEATPETTERFSEIAHAYEVLSDSDTRKKYDIHGEEGLKDQNSNNQYARRESKVADLIFKVQVTLDELYHGAEKSAKMTRQVICPYCRGSGAEMPDDLVSCGQCKGQGFTVIQKHIGRGMYQQYRQNCEKCSGTGKLITKPCHRCHAKKITGSYENFVFFIEKGSPNGYKIHQPDQGDEWLNVNSADFYFKLVQVPHPLFSRDGDNLHYTMKISLREALLGFRKAIPHLDGNAITVKRDGVTQPGHIERLRGKGMPKFEHYSVFGDLIVTFKVIYPEEFSSQQLKYAQEFFHGTQREDL